MQITPTQSVESLRLFIGQLSEPPAALLSKAILSILVLAESLVCIFWIYALSGLGEGYALMAAVPYVYFVLSYTSLLIFYRLKRFDYFTFIQLVMLLVMPYFMQWLIGGFSASSGVAIWAILSPVGALMILGARQSTPWFVLFIGLAGISWYLNPLFAGNALPIPTHLKDIFSVINMAGLSVILYIVMRYFQSQKAKVLDALAIEKARSEQLLLSIFPQSVADSLKISDAHIAEHHDAVTIMFADLVDFTGVSADMSPADLVNLLNQVFSRFDELTEKYALEKIKTIGDSYMVVGGVPVSRPDHAAAVVNMALEISGILAEVSAATGKKLSMRIGINSGPVVAGVIGHSKFSYDLWGDTVNLASRMEQLAIPNTIQVTEATYQLLQNEYIFETRGLISVKGKGEVLAYILKGKR
ncbi:adenylate/guanylate cyclase domain-containing protein [Methylovorus sp. MM2]|uniref:adenylate/guanylate cyclase domain-containing protein n=1 Tax=Methylovorus sp. MM2 TaxID=1848038 RepID=UPI000A65BA77|nr:adenylate/guanylate cyclase domain-containing protein [Methylovorus sp. MM2]